MDAACRGELMGKGRLKPEGSIGFAAIFSFSSSASCSLFALALRFWNQILTWVSVRFRELENSARSAMERYCFWRNLRSRARSWDVVKGVRGFRLVLCFRRVQVVGLMCPREQRASELAKEGVFSQVRPVRVSPLLHLSKRDFCQIHVGRGVPGRGGDRRRTIFKWSNCFLLRN